MENFFSKLFKKENRNSSGVIFDIGNGLVTAALIRFEDGKPPLIEAVARREISQKGRVGAKALANQTAISCSKVAYSLVRSNLPTQFPTNVDIHIFLSAPWAISKGVTASLVSNKPTIISGSYIKGGLSRVEHHDPSKNDSGALLERVVVGATVDGYRVDDPVGKI